ncbi:hypothetical protein BDM02DRAFT_3133119 [Thelephora ganbajun]|uniref:Uncharacterized protein n=1 Tax=Thelephora ganbajun TaxID=370292 RepID=A0ACB6YYA6_THEGA|nr:hypothetical protein BDM02DRAFT_3133119 [Thelephora ganbajun]
MKGAHAARNTNVNVIRQDIFILSHNDTKKRGWLMPATIKKTSRGIKSEKLINVIVICGITILCSPSTGHGWKYPEQGARSFSASQKESNTEINGINKVVFTIHNSKCFSRELSRIDLSELYHNVVTVLRTKTEWASKTLGFWNKIFFGEREEEEEEPKTKLFWINPKGVPVLTSRFHSQKSPLLSNRKTVRRGRLPFLTPTPTLVLVTSKDPTTHPPQKKKQRRYLTEQESPLATPQPMICTKKKQAIEAFSNQSQNHAMRDTWKDIRRDLKRLIGHATVAGYKEAGAEFTRIVSMGAEEGTRYFNENYEHIVSNAR